MSGRIIPLHGDQHHQAISLLPWYVNGRLEAAERDALEAHLAECPECQTELRLERRLKAELDDLPIVFEPGWERLRARLDMGAERRKRRPLAARVGIDFGGAGRKLRVGGPWLGWAVAAQAAVLLVVAGLVWLPSPRAARYRTLGATPASDAANVVVIFRPDTRERDLRAALTAIHARLVDGPTAAGVWMVHVPAAERAAALTNLRTRGDIALAEPVDSSRSP